MQEYIRNGIHYFLNALLQLHPKLIPLRYYSQEITTLIDFIKDFISISTHGGTYAEQFFGFTRSATGNISRWNAIKGALIWAVIPYLTAKFDLLFKKIEADQIDGVNNISFFKKAFKAIYPYVYLILSLLQTFYKFRYLYLQNGN